MNRIGFSIVVLLAMVGLIGCKDTGIVPPDGEQPPTDYSAPAWSPDGNWIAYYHDGRGNDSTYPEGLYLVDTSGSNRRLLVPGFATAPAWRPDGNSIAFTTGRIYEVSFENDSIVLLVEVGRFPQWSPEGNKIVYTRSGTQDTVGIWIFDLVTRLRYRLGFGDGPDWSPDGTRFVYSGPPGNTGTGSQIWTMDTSGNNRVQLTMNTLTINRDPRWSADGRMIAWTVIRNATTFEVWLMDSCGNNQHKLTAGQYSSFSPDSRKVVFSKFDRTTTKYDLWAINIDGTDMHQLTH